MRLRRALPGLVVPVLLSTACGGGGTSGTVGTTGGGVNASCVAPFLDSVPPDGPSPSAAPHMAPGSPVTVYGHWYTTTCNDTGGHPPLQPMDPVHLTVTYPSGAVQHVGPFTPHGPDMGFVATIEVPDGTPRGVATIRDDHGDRPYRFEVDGPAR